MLISKIKLNKLISFSFLMLFLAGLVLPTFTFAANPTIKLNLAKEQQNGQTHKWSWIITITTTDVANNTPVTVLLFEEKNADTHGTGKQIPEGKYISTIKNNSANYYTDYILDTDIFYSVTVQIGNTMGYFSKKAGTSGTIVVNGQTTVPVVTTQNTAKTETNYYPLAPLPGVGETCTPDKSNPAKTICIKTAADCTDPKNCTPSAGFGNYLNVMINLFIGLCAVLAMIMIIMGGIQYMTSELISGKEAGKEQIIHAILGLLLAVGAWALLNTINPDLLKISLGDVKPVTITIDPETESAPWTGTAQLTSPTSTCTEGYVNVNTQGSPNTINVCKSISNNLTKMIAAAKTQKNIILSGSGSRTYAQQVSLRQQHGCPDIYNSPSSQCAPPTARPGHSKHESGKAVDFNCNGAGMTKENVCFVWLQQNAITYGFKNLASEPWHWSDSGN